MFLFDFIVIRRDITQGCICISVYMFCITSSVDTSISDLRIGIMSVSNETSSSGTSSCFELVIFIYCPSNLSCLSCYRLNEFQAFYQSEYELLTVFQASRSHAHWYWSVNWSVFTGVWSVKWHFRLRNVEIFTSIFFGGSWHIHNFTSQDYPYIFKIKVLYTMSSE